MALNQSMLLGRLVNDAELRYTQNGTAVASFTLAVARDYKDANGDRPADFVRCVIWGDNTKEQGKQKPEIFADNTAKGDLLDIIGRIETRNFDGEDGKKVWLTEVNVRDFHFISSPQDNQQNNNNKGNNRNGGNRNNKSSRR